MLDLYEVAIAHVTAGAGQQGIQAPDTACHQVTGIVTICAAYPAISYRRTAGGSAQTVPADPGYSLRFTGRHWPGYKLQHLLEGRPIGGAKGLGDKPGAKVSLAPCLSQVAGSSPCSAASCWLTSSTTSHSDARHSSRSPLPQ